MKTLKRIIIGITVMLSSCMSTKQNSVDQVKYLGTKINSSDIYINKQSSSFYSPLNINILPMDRLMLIDFDGDSLYETIELQVYNDFRGKGATVILYGKNGENDVYYTDSVFVNSRLFKGHVYENKEIKYFLNVSNNSLEANVELKDKFGRNISAIIKEGLNTNNPKSFLAPIGGIIKTFSFFPLFYMEKFNFVKRAGTSIIVKINNNILKPKKIPILLNGSFVYMARYSTEPVIGCLNDIFDGKLMPFIPSSNKYSAGDISYELTKNSGHFEIAKVVCAKANHKIGILFSPAIPDLVNLKNKITVTGKFSIEVDSITGIVAGEYRITSLNNEINVTMSPTKAYSPMSGKLWVLNYNWNAKLINTDGIITMNSKWSISGNN